MLGFGFGLHDGISVVVATMASWNKVSPASPDLINVSGGVEGEVRVGAVRIVLFPMDLDSCCVVQGKLFVGLWWDIFDLFARLDLR